MIRGETSHYDYVCAEAARGIQDVQLATGVPCAFGVITCETMEQALARAGGDKRDQGRSAAVAVMRMALLRAGSRVAHGDRYHPARHGQGLPQLRQGPAFGNSRSHSMVATRRRFNPNLQKVRIEDGRPHPPRLRLHALPEVEQGHQGRLTRRTRSAR